MAERTYKVIELVGVSKTSYAEATRSAIAKASLTLEGLSWFEVTDLRGAISNGRVAEFQVTLKVGFRLQETAPARSSVKSRVTRLRRARAQ